MAARKIYDSGCAKCGVDDGTLTTYTISAGAQTAVVELCGRHGKPITDLMPYGNTDPKERLSTASPHTKPVHRVVAIEDL